MTFYVTPCNAEVITTEASLGWVSPGEATEGVTPIFLKKKLATFFVINVCQLSGVTPIYFLLKNWRPFCSSLLPILLGCHPHGGCHPTPFLPLRPRLFTILCKFVHFEICTFRTFRKHSRMYFLIVLTTDYCLRSWTSRIAAPYKSRVDWLIDLPTIFSFGCQPRGCHPGRSAPALPLIVTPLHNHTSLLN